MRRFSSPLHTLARAAAVCALAVSLAPHARTQTTPSRVRGLEMLEAVKRDLKEHYYDPSFRGMDVDARFEAVARKVKAAPSYGSMFSSIAQALSELNDSHTYLLPPDRGLGRIDYGWRMQMIGDACRVVEVRRGSEAEAEGLRVGDTVLSIDGHTPTRATFWKVEYSYYTLMPRPSVRLSVSSPGGPPRELNLTVKDFDKRPNFFASLAEQSHRSKRAEALRLPAFRELGGGAAVCRMTSFVLREKEIDEAMAKAARYDSLVIDLRANGGGYAAALSRFAGYFFDRDVKIADIKSRRGIEPQTAKTRGGKVFKGRLVVLVDSRTGSAAELFARVVQLEKRGSVLGDRTAGAVMLSQTFAHVFDKLKPGEMWGEAYGVSITVADVIMADGKSLEHTGVTPDELLLPSPADMASGRDPALARAAAVLGLELDPGKAGALFPSK